MQKSFIKIQLIALSYYNCVMIAKMECNFCLLLFPPCCRKSQKDVAYLVSQFVAFL